MRNTKKAKKIKMYIKMFFSIALLIGLTLLVLEIPKIFYQREDMRLVKNVSSSEYDLESTTVDMSEKDISDAMFSDDTMFIETNKQYTNSEIVAYKKQVFELMDAQNLDKDWKKFFERVLIGKYSDTKFSTVRIVRIIDDVIYSGEIGILTVYNKEGITSLCNIAFDIQSGKMIYISCYVYDGSEPVDDLDSDIHTDIEESSEVDVETYYDESIGFVTVEYDVTSDEYRQKICEELDNWFIVPEENLECASEFTYIEPFYFYIAPFSMMNPHWVDDIYGHYVEWEYNDVADKLYEIINKQETLLTNSQG